MAINSNDDERSIGTDREQQRTISNESARSARSTNGDSATNADDTAANPVRGKSNRGFASMDRSKQREIASKGGRAAHEKGTAHEFDAGEARAAGRKGGVTVSKNRDHMAAIGRRGGEARGANRAARLQGANGADAKAPQPNQSVNGSAHASDREVGLRGSAQPRNGAGQSARPNNMLATDKHGGANDVGAKMA